MTFAEQAIKIYQNYKSNQIPTTEIKLLKESLDKIILNLQQQIKPLDSSITLDVNQIDQNLNNWFFKVDQKLFEVQEKIFSPEGIKLNLSLDIRYMEDWNQLVINSIDINIILEDVENESDKLLTNYFYNTVQPEIYKHLNIPIEFLLITASRIYNTESRDDVVHKLKIIHIISDN